MLGSIGNHLVGKLGAALSGLGERVAKQLGRDPTAIVHPQPARLGVL